MTREEAIAYGNDYYIDLISACCKIDEKHKEFVKMSIKALEQEPRKGHWISHGEHCRNLGVRPSGLGAYEWCSNCDCGIDVREWHRSRYNYCPNCGSDNREVEE